MEGDTVSRCDAVDEGVATGGERRHLDRSSPSVTNRPSRANARLCTRALSPVAVSPVTESTERPDPGVDGQGVEAVVGPFATASFPFPHR
jgi:hypothetical protein